MAQVIESRFICDGRYRIQSINAVGRHRGRIIEIEDVDRRERFHGTASKLDRLVLILQVQASQDRRDSLKRGAR
jgi:hypothetical protein